MTVRPFLLQGTTRRHALHRRLTEAAADWAGRWLPTGDIAVGDVEAPAADISGGGEWVRCGLGRPGTCFWTADEAGYATLAARLGGFPEDALPEMAVTGAVRRWVDLALADLFAGLEPDIGPERDIRHGELPRARLMAPGSGALQVRIAVGESAEVMAVLDGEATVACLGPQVRTDKLAPRARLADLRRTLGGMPVAVRARIAADGLTAQDIAALAPGDVVVLDHALDEPVPLSAASVRFGAGYLGRADGNRALRMTRA